MFDEYASVCIEGLKYTVELNTSTVFNNAVYLGTKKINGKTILIFSVKGDRQLGINPSYHTYTLENESEFEEDEIEQTGNIDGVPITDNPIIQKEI